MSKNKYFKGRYLEHRYILRISFQQCEGEEGFSRVLKFLKASRIPEILMFSPTCWDTEPNFLVQDELVRRINKMKRLFDRFRTNGIVCSINVWNTLGMTSSTGECRRFNFKYMEDMNGLVSDACPCPLDRSFVEYLKYFFKLLAMTKPNIIFIDDDFNNFNHPYPYSEAQYPLCFCQSHIESFNIKYGAQYSRKDIVKKLRQGLNPVKEQWADFNLNILVELATEIRHAVHEVRPETRLGLMISGAQEGFVKDNIISALAGDHRPLARPYQPVYSDLGSRLDILSSGGIPGTLFERHFFPPHTESYVELDSGAPWNRFKKSARFFINFQSKICLAANFKIHTLLAFPSAKNNFLEDNRYLKEIRKVNPFLRKLSGFIPDSSTLEGVQLMANPRVPLFFPIGQCPEMVPTALILGRLGIPFTYEESPVAILSRGQGYTMDREEIKNKKGIILDGAALGELLDTGKLELPGIKITRDFKYGEIIYEQFSNADFNKTVEGSIVGVTRYLDIKKIYRISLSKSSPVSIIEVSSFFDLDKKRSSGAVFLIEYKGQKICIFPYEFGDISVSGNVYCCGPRRVQLQNILRWMMDGCFPLLVSGDAAVDICPFMLRDLDSPEIVVGLANIGFDDAYDFNVEIHTGKREGKIISITDDGTFVPVSSKRVRYRNGTSCVKIDESHKIQNHDVKFLCLSLL